MTKLAVRSVDSEEVKQRERRRGKGREPLLAMDKTTLAWAVVVTSAETLSTVSTVTAR
jgi:hypothetical protein